jgi:hypothetical protein
VLEPPGLPGRLPPPSLPPLAPVALTIKDSETVNLFNFAPDAVNMPASVTLKLSPREISPFVIFTMPWSVT